MTTGQTRHAPTLEGYAPPEQQARRERMAAQWRKMPRVNNNGFPIAMPDPTVVETVAPTAPPSMATALAEVAAACGADLATLLDSNGFTADIARISPADSEALTATVRAYMPAQTPGMKVNPSQGHVAGSVPAPASGDLLSRLKAEAEKSLSQPEPPGSTYR